MAAFERLLSVPATHPIEVLMDPDDGSVILSQRATAHGNPMVVQIPAGALRGVARCLETAAKAGEV